MNTTRLNRIRDYVAAHGFKTYIAGGAVMIEIPYYKDGEIVETKTEQADSFSEAREILGY